MEQTIRIIWREVTGMILKLFGDLVHHGGLVERAADK
jgi:hypothetical protein